MRFTWIVLAVPFLIATTDPADPADPAGQVIEASMRAMGSRSALEQIQAVELTGIRQEMLLSVAQDPETPKVVSMEYVENRDVGGLRALRRNTFRIVTRPAPINFSQYIADGVASADAREELDLAPERILLLAATAPERRLLADTVLAGRRVRVVAWGQPEIRLYVDAETGLPAGWTSVRSYADDLATWAVWGDVRTRVAWSSWSAEPTGLRYPRTTHLWRNGALVRVTSLVSIDWNAPFPADSFADLTARRETFLRSQGATLGGGITEHAGGIVHIPGTYNVTLARDPDGVLIFEAPHSSGYSRAVLAEVERRWPGAPVKGVVLTSYMWPHLAGVREYIARGVRLYASPRTAATVREIAASAHRLTPDSLARAPRAPVLHEVRDSARIGTAVIFRSPQPGGEHGRDMLLVGFDHTPIAYLGDLFVPQRFEPNLWTQSTAEGIAALRMAGVRADTVLSLHNPPTSRAELEATLAPVMIRR